MYKCISKIIASRLKRVLSGIVNDAQSAFIPGRSISDNILLAHELFRGYDRETGASRCALKIDLHKAFDTLNWDFIVTVLHKIHLPVEMISWIRGCICSPRYSVKLNGIIHGFFKGTVGIRQGDPLSPYLFSLSMNILSCLLTKTPVGYKHHWRCKDLNISHLFFADDVLLFARGCKDSVSHIMDNLAVFSIWSGLKPSVHKSTSFLCNCDSEFAAWFDSTYSIPRGSLPVKFLGVPLIASQLCINDCVPLGFWCSHFILPSVLHRNIQSMLTKFLWKGNINQKGGAKVAWDDICLPKEEGGLGLKNMVHWNKARMIHHLLKVIIKSPTLWATWVNRTVLKHKYFWIIKVPTDCSWIWRKILNLRNVAIQYISYHIVTGDSLSLWFDPWWKSFCLANSISTPIINQCSLPHTATVASVTHSGQWLFPRPSMRIHHAAPLLTAWIEDPELPTIHSSGSDHILWDGVSASKIRTWNIWNSIRDSKPTVLWHKEIWHRLQITRFSHHQWLTCLNRLNTLARLHRFGIASTQQCFLCIMGRETTTHLFLQCTYSRWILLELFGHLGISVDHASWTDFLENIAELKDKAKGMIAACYAQVFCYHIWRERNARAHGKGMFGPMKLLHGMVQDIKARLTSSDWFNAVICSRPDLLLL
ncbi:uncharacterized protein LOC141674313 [Apium graveolens]|uniref:uncharacterized protein LOC141674313 n=1 Tax=Apium graveolens TaxID=4045 RepID=UPI003D78F58C